MSRDRMMKTRPVMGSAWAEEGKEIWNLRPGFAAGLAA
jgi:hypothetical protein